MPVWSGPPGREQQPLSSLYLPCITLLFSLDEIPSLLSAQQPGPRPLDQSSKMFRPRSRYGLRDHEPLARRTGAPEIRLEGRY